MSQVQGARANIKQLSKKTKFMGFFQRQQKSEFQRGFIRMVNAINENIIITMDDNDLLKAVIIFFFKKYRDIWR